MIGLIPTYFTALVDLIKDVWLWLLLGFVIAALVQEFISSKQLLSHFGKNNVISLFKASVVGLFVSVCSCGAIPLAATLRDRGASTASTLTFLLATPWAGLVHLFIITSFIGIQNALILFSLSLVVAFDAGLIFARLENRDLIAKPTIHETHVKGERFKCEECREVEELKHRAESIVKRLFVCVPRNVNHIFWDIGKYIVIGLLIAAALKAFVSAESVAQYLGAEGGLYGIPPVLLAIPASAVVELCSEGFTILAGQLYTMGASLAVVFVMIMVGVTTDITELSMLWGKFGKKTTIVYLMTSTLLVIIFAYLISWIQ